MSNYNAAAYAKEHKEELERRYDALMELVTKRRNIREFTSDPIPEGYIEKILECARWAMSGANSQAWDFIVVTDKDLIHKLYDECYLENHMDYLFWLEQQRSPELRQCGFQVPGMENMDPEEVLAAMKNKKAWREAPAVIAVVGDGRRQWGTVLGGHTMGLGQTHLTDGLAMVSYLIHLSAASLGLGALWCSVSSPQDPYKRVLGIPDPLIIHNLIPIGYPSEQPHGGYREPIEDHTHLNQYDMTKYLSNKDCYERLRMLRQRTMRAYAPFTNDKHNLK